MYHYHIYDEQIGRHFHNYCSDQTHFTFKELLTFFRDEQKEPHSTDPASLVWDFVNLAGGHRDPRQPSLTLPEVSLLIY